MRARIEEQGIEEERRLAYVGLTRAQERLTLTTPPRARSGARATTAPEPVPRRAPAGRDRARAAAADLVDAATTRRAPSQLPTGPTPDLSTGDSVRHSTLGEGVVVRIEGDGT